MLAVADRLVRADAEHDGIGLFPMAVQVQHAAVAAPHHALRIGIVRPADIAQVRDRFDQPVVVGRHQRDAPRHQAFEQPDHRGILGLQRLKRVGQPAAQFVVFAQTLFDQLRRSQQHRRILFSGQHVAPTMLAPRRRNADFYASLDRRLDQPRPRRRLRIRRA
jgi:hypothetical protein